MVKSTMTGTVMSSGRGGTVAAMAQNEQMAEEHSTLEQQPPGRRDHPAWCVMWKVQPASTTKHSDDDDMSLCRQSGGGQQSWEVDIPQEKLPQHLL